MGKWFASEIPVPVRQFRRSLFNLLVAATAAGQCIPSKAETSSILATGWSFWKAFKRDMKVCIVLGEQSVRRARFGTKRVSEPAERKTERQQQEGVMH